MVPNAMKPTPSAPPPSAVKLLLVDDEEANLVALKAMLADLGYPMVTARSAQETFRYLLQEEFALLLLDVAMPGLNGLELATLLHEREETHLTPTIFITAHYDDTESVARSYEAGGVDYLIKPVNPEVLRAKVQVFAQLAQARQQLKAEVAERRRAEQELQQLNQVLEQRVAQRTCHLTQANEALVREVTERKRAEAALHQTKAELAQANENLEHLVSERTAKLQEALSELEHFSYTITHDMRAPLRTMQGFGHMLLGDAEDNLSPKRRDFLRRIVDSAGRMDNLITDTLNYSKIMRQELELGPVDATALLHGMVESYSQFQPPKADIHIKSHIPLILANEAGLTQCFSNLLGNAVKFVHPDRIPRVQVRAEDRGQYVRLWFEDNGIGIPKQYHEQIFIMFQRLSKTYEGTGIGLALVRKTVERMKGKIGVESEPGQGSRFWMELERCV
jgi:signal transduction histidine kinase